MNYYIVYTGESSEAGPLRISSSDTPVVCSHSAVFWPVISGLLVSVSSLAGLESVRKLQWLSVHHNQLISTKGLKDVFTLLHLDCSHNHLARVEGLENNALLSTLDLRANSLTEVQHHYYYQIQPNRV